jgi:hypothetical protein
VKAVILITLAVLSLAACGHSRPKSVRYILGNRVSGWVRITYNRSDAPPLPVKDGVVIVRIPPAMKLSTRNSMTPDWAGAEFYYEKSNGQLIRLPVEGDEQRRLWGMEKTPGPDGDQETFFVGKPEQFTQIYKDGNNLNTGLSDKPIPTPLDAATAPDELMKIQTELPKK